MEPTDLLGIAVVVIAAIVLFKAIKIGVKIAMVGLILVGAYLVFTDGLPFDL